MTEAQMLFKRLRNVALKQPARSPRYRKFVRETKVGQDIECHHVFGSAMSLKSSDYLSVAVEHNDHSIHQNDPQWCIDQIPEAIGNLLRYVELLEKELAKKS